MKRKTKAPQPPPIPKLLWNLKFEILLGVFGISGAIFAVIYARDKRNQRLQNPESFDDYIGINPDDKERR